MCSTSTHRLTALLGTVALAAFAIGCGAVESGTVIEVSADSVTVADDTSFTHTTYKVSPDASIVKDGQPAVLADIEQGDDVSVTVSQDTEGNQVATVVSVESNGAADEAAASGEAPLYVPPIVETPTGAETQDDKDPNSDPSSMRAYQGDVMAVGDDTLTLSDPAGTQLAFIVNDETEITINGEQAELDAIGAGFVAIVTARQDLDELVAVEIEAAAPASARDPVDDQNTEAPGTESEIGEQPQLPEGPQL